MQQRTIDKLRKKLTKERKRRSKIQGKLKLSQEQSLQLQEALNAANKENERLETAREAQVLHKTNFTKPLHIPRLEHQQLAQIEKFHNHNSSFYKDKIKTIPAAQGVKIFDHDRQMPHGDFFGNELSSFGGLPVELLRECKGLAIRQNPAWDEQKVVAAVIHRQTGVRSSVIVSFATDTDAAEALKSNNLLRSTPAGARRHRLPGMRNGIRWHIP